MKRPFASLFIVFCAIGFLGFLLMSTIKPNSLLASSVSTHSGIVSNLNNELLEYVNPEKPTHDHSSQYYQRFYVSKFNLGSQSLEATFSSPMKIAEGDTLTVSGHTKGNTFKVLAYKNQTQGVVGYENWVVSALGALFFLAVAIGLLNSQVVIEGELISKLFLFGFSLLAIYMGYRALLIREAISLISN